MLPDGASENKSGSIGDSPSSADEPNSSSEIASSTAGAQASVQRSNSAEASQTPAVTRDGGSSQRRTVDHTVTAGLPPGLRTIEERIEQLLVLVEQLNEENRALRAQQNNLVTERAALIEKSELARSRVEAMIARFKAMEVLS